MKVVKRPDHYLKEPIPVDDELAEVVQQQPIFWSDDRLCHWFFDFQFKGSWISCWRLNNELTECVIEIL